MNGDGRETPSTNCRIGGDGREAPSTSLGTCSKVELCHHTRRMSRTYPLENPLLLAFFILLEE